MTVSIGNWAKRPGGKYHLIESVIDGDAVTRCGRRMDRVASRGELQVSDVMPLTRAIGQPQLCRAGCQRSTSVPDPWEDRAAGARVEWVADDDGSTAPVDDTP